MTFPSSRSHVQTLPSYFSPLNSSYNELLMEFLGFLELPQELASSSLLALLASSSSFASAEINIPIPRANDARW